MRHAVLVGYKNFDHLVFSNEHCHQIVYGPLVFRLHPNETATAGIKPATFGSAAEHITATPSWRTFRAFRIELKALCHYYSSAWPSKRSWPFNFTINGAQITQTHGCSCLAIMKFGLTLLEK